MKVYGNGSVEKRGKNRWRLTIVDGYKSDGSPTKLHKTIAANNKTQATVELANWIAYLKSKADNIPIEKITMVYAADAFIRDAIKLRKMEDKRLKESPEESSYDALSHRTIGSYEEIINSRIKPWFEGRLLTEITCEDLSEFYRHLRYEGGKNSSPLSVSTVKKTVTLVNQIFRYGLRHGWIANNPNEYAQKYTGRRRCIDPNNKKVELNPEDMKKVAETAPYIQNKGLGIAIMLASHAGLRRAEACGLRWCDVDFENRLIKIRNDLSILPKSLRTPGSSILHLGPTKTPESLRDLPIIDPLYEFLQQLYKDQKGKAKCYGYEFSEKSHLVTNSRGLPMNPDTITTETKNFILDIGLNPAASYKSLRSGVASLLAAYKVPIHIVAAILGHTEERTTFKYYLKYSQCDLNDAMKVLSKVFES